MNTPADAFTTLGEDLLLLSIRPRDGKIMTARRIDYGLMGAELIRLAAAGRIDIVDDRVVVRDPAATGDAELDAALLTLVGSRPPRPETWVGLPRRGIRDAYASRLISAGALREPPSGGIFSSRRYRIAAPERAAAARSRLDAITQSTGPQVDVGQAAFGGLASAIGLGHVLYPGRPGRSLRARLIQIARWEPAAHTTSAAAAGSAAAGSAAAGSAATGSARTDSAGAMSAATSAAVHAATSAVVNGAHSVAADSADLHSSGLHGGGINWAGTRPP
jgi:hypothetical protein